MPVQQCRYEYSDVYEADVEVCEMVETAEESAANWAAINEAEARYQEAAEAAWGPGGVPPCAGPGQQGDQCCPGLTSVWHPGEYDPDYPDWGAYYTCEQPPPPPPPPQTFTGYVSGPLAVNVAVGGCRGSSGWVVGKQSDCNDRYDAARAKTVHEWRAYYVDGPVPNQSLCPQIGTLANAQWVDNNNKPGFVTGEYGIGDKIRLQCAYSSITNPFDTRAIDTFKGPETTDLATIQKAWCDAKNYAGLKNNGDCRTFYTNRQDYDFQLVSRIQIENPNGEWATNPDYLLIVTQVAAGRYSAGSSVGGRDLARGMINNYCMTQNRQWPDIENIRVIINMWALQPSDVDDATRLFAAAIIEGYCRSNPSSSHCDCFNANQFGTNIFDACRGNTSTACTDINIIAQSFDAAAPIFAPQIRALKNYITPKCAVGACVSAATSAISPYLPPTNLAALKCESNITVCLQNVKVGGDLRAAINQSCATNLAIGGPVPPDPTPSTNQGFQNVQAVQANANAPGGGTLAAVSSPGVSSTQVTTTGTPGGGINQNITSNTPVGIASSGGPVSYTSPAPERIEQATMSTTVPSDNTQKYALAAGGGLLGLSCSCLFLIFIIVIAMLMFGGGNSKPAAPPVIPLGAYGL